MSRPNFAYALGPVGYRPYRISWDKGGPSLEPEDGTPESVLMPGFVDIHIHGSFGIDFMSCSQAELISLADQLSEIGVESFLPTTVTASPAQVADAIAKLPSSVESILGFHLEGPFISDKYPGAQPQGDIAGLPPSPAWEPILADLRLRVITMAPELTGALPLIQQLASRGVIVSMGHTNATYVECAAAYASGARHTTHTFNAMRPLHHREAGTVGFALAHPELGCELIYDRLHVSQPAAQILIQAKSPDKLIAVSDSTLATGLEPGQTIKMWGLDCVTAPGEIRLAVDGTLAGSAISIRDAFFNLASDFGFEIAIRACCYNPRMALGQSSRPRVWQEVSLDLSRHRVMPDWS